MVTATTQSKRIKAEAKAKADAEAKVDAELVKAKRRAKGGYPCTEEDIVRERDTRGLSWRQVAINLSLGSPGQARKAYTALTGRPHETSQMTGRRAVKGTTGRKLAAPEWTDESDQDEIIARLHGSRITVAHNYKGLKWEEDVEVLRVVKLTFDGPEERLAAHVVDRLSSATRCFRVADIVAVQ